MSALTTSQIIAESVQFEMDKVATAQSDLDLANALVRMLVAASVGLGVLGGSDLATRTMRQVIAELPDSMSARGFE